VIALKAEQTLRIKPWSTARIECVTGVLWVTREGDWRDFIVASGEFIEVDGGLTVAVALEPATVRVARRSHWSWLRGVLAPLRLEIPWRSASASIAMNIRDDQVRPVSAGATGTMARS
jgi:hypothetical protein